MKPIIGYLAERTAFIQCFIVFVAESFMPFLYKHFYALSFVLYQKVSKNRTTKQYIWILCKTNLGKYSLCNLCSRCRGGDVADILLAGRRKTAYISLVCG